VEFFVFILFLFLVFGLLGGEKKPKARKKTRALRAGGRNEDKSQDYPQSWKNYEAAERSEGMQDDPDPSRLFDVSKAKLEKARAAAAGKLSYEGLPTAPSAPLKNKGRTIASHNPSAAHQPPLVRDMNLQRRIFLSGGRNTIFGERGKKGGGVKTLLGFAVLGAIALFLARAISG